VNWDAVQALAELTAAFGVLASLLYVGSQIRQNTQAVRSATAQAVHDNYAAWYQGYANDPALMRIAVDGLRDFQALDEVAKAQFIALFMQFLSYSQNAFFQWREGALSPELWSGWELLMMNLVSAPGGKQFWLERGYVFGEAFRSHVEDVIMKRPPHPRARPLGAFAIGDASAEEAAPVRRPMGTA